MPTCSKTRTRAFAQTRAMTCESCTVRDEGDWEMYKERISMSGRRRNYVLDVQKYCDTSNRRCWVQCTQDHRRHARHITLIDTDSFVSTTVRRSISTSAYRCWHYSRINRKTDVRRRSSKHSATCPTCRKRPCLTTQLLALYNKMAMYGQTRGDVCDHQKAA